MATTESFDVEVAYARPERQMIIRLKVAAGTTAGQAVRQSGILEQFDDIDPAQMARGIFSRAISEETVLREHDRVEIYRPLIADPQAVRRARAEAGKSMKKGGSGE